MLFVPWSGGVSLGPHRLDAVAPEKVHKDARKRRTDRATGPVEYWILKTAELFPRTAFSSFSSARPGLPPSGPRSLPYGRCPTTAGPAPAGAGRQLADDRSAPRVEDRCHDLLVGRVIWPRRNQKRPGCASGAGKRPRSAGTAQSSTNDLAGDSSPAPAFCTAGIRAEFGQWAWGGAMKAAGTVGLEAFQVVEHGTARPRGVGAGECGCVGGRAGAKRSRKGYGDRHNDSTNCRSSRSLLGADQRTRLPRIGKLGRNTSGVCAASLLPTTQKELVS